MGEEPRTATAAVRATRQTGDSSPQGARSGIEKSLRRWRFCFTGERGSADDIYGGAGAGGCAHTSPLVLSALRAGNLRTRDRSLDLRRKVCRFTLPWTEEPRTYQAGPRYPVGADRSRKGWGSPAGPVPGNRKRGGRASPSAVARLLPPPCRSREARRELGGVLDARLGVVFFRALSAARHLLQLLGGEWFLLLLNVLVGLDLFFAHVFLLGLGCLLTRRNWLEHSAAGVTRCAQNGHPRKNLRILRAGFSRGATSRAAPGASAD